MAQKSTIEWTESTWNPVTGCDKVSPGCANCYAERMARRLQAMSQPNYANGFRVTLHDHALDTPLTWKRPQMVFVNSMSDLFHRDVPLHFIQRVFNVMGRASWHVFQVLTKRSERLFKLSPYLEWPDNVWMGVSVETAAYLRRLDHLRNVPSKVRFISFEPLLGPMGLFDLDGIDWCIVGGESGPGSRPIKQEWVTEIRDQCNSTGVPFFFKQWGGTNKKKTGRRLENRTWSELPKSTFKSFFHSA